jgi:hypothetical protein
MLCLAASDVNDAGLMNMTNILTAELGHLPVEKRSQVICQTRAAGSTA